MSFSKSTSYPDRPTKLFSSPKHGTDREELHALKTLLRRHYGHVKYVAIQGPLKIELTAEVQHGILLENQFAELKLVIDRHLKWGDHVRVLEIMLFFEHSVFQCTNCSSHNQVDAHCTDCGKLMRKCDQCGARCQTKDNCTQCTHSFATDRDRSAVAAIALMKFGQNDMIQCQS